MTLLCHFNFLLFRWIEIEMSDGKPLRGIILQRPWWDLRTAMFKGRFFKI